mgnify:CR=1 FL=1
MTYLDKMAPGQKGKVVGFCSECRVTRRLMELGVLPGRDIVYLRNAPLRDPLEVRIGECRLSFRHAEASLIAVEVDT